MNRKELEIKLNESNISPNTYSLYGGVDINKTILNFDLLWSIYEIDERGNVHIIKDYEKEDDACDYFYILIMKIEYWNNKIETIIEEEPEQNKRTFYVSTDGNISTE